MSFTKEQLRQEIIYVLDRNNKEEFLRHLLSFVLVAERVMEKAKQ